MVIWVKFHKFRIDFCSARSWILHTVRRSFRPPACRDHLRLHFRLSDPAPAFLPDRTMCERLHFITMHPAPKPASANPTPTKPVCVKALLRLLTIEGTLFCTVIITECSAQRQVFHRILRNQGCSLTTDD